MPDPLTSLSRLTAESVRGCSFPPPTAALFERLERALIDWKAATELDIPPGLAVRVTYAELAVIVGARPEPSPPPLPPQARKKESPPDGT